MKKQNGLIAAAVAAAMSAPVYAAEVTVSGAVEVEASQFEGYDGITSSDIIVATAALGVDAELNNRVSAHLAFLYEEDENAFDGATFGLDEATLSLKLNQKSTLTAGRMYVPFGNFGSSMVSDPLTLELGETSETVMMLSTEDRGVNASVYAFMGDADEIPTDPNADDTSFSYGASLDYNTDTLWLGASYISNIADSDFLQTEGQTITSTVAGMSAYFGVKMGTASLHLEYLAADDFTNGDSLVDGTVTVGNTEAPSATNAELAFELSNGATFALAYQTTDEALFLEMPETVMSAAYVAEIMPGASLGFEYASFEDYSTADGGSGKDGTVYTMQLAVEF